MDSANQLQIQDRRESILTNGVNGSASLSTSSIANGNGGQNSSRRTSIINPATGRRRASMFDPIDPMEIQKTLYQSQNKEKAVAATNNSSEQLNSESIIGKIEFGIQFLPDSHKLIVDILRIFDLSNAKGDPNSDLYCKCTLLPEKQSFQTKSTKRTFDPVFDDQLEFERIELSSFEYRSLELALYESDKYGREECLGLTYFRLNNQNIETKKIYLKDLRPCSKSSEDNLLGELMFSLAYLPAAERLTVVVMKARNIRTMGLDKKNYPDPYVKVNIINKNDGKKIKKKKTSTQKSTISPVYNEEFSFNLKKEQLDEILISFTLVHDSLTNRETLGSVSISSTSKGDEYIQWKEMIDGKKAIGWWHHLSLNNTGSESDGGGSGNGNSSSSRSNYSRQSSQTSNWIRKHSKLNG